MSAPGIIVFAGVHQVQQLTCPIRNTALLKKRLIPLIALYFPKVDVLPHLVNAGVKPKFVNILTDMNRLNVFLKVKGYLNYIFVILTIWMSRTKQSTRKWLRVSGMITFNMALVCLFFLGRNEKLP
ncbi:hypothetical protein [Gynuella sunshinyii]|uniref:hypothetical protein n=1 Tax=Gynuella sunshinyii TaxID=1445505 RepID=UPI001186CFC0|nr:hypothetical protein [Gynuella sunshinyii]